MGFEFVEFIVLNDSEGERKKDEGERLESWEAGMLEGSDTSELSGLPACSLYSLPAVLGLNFFKYLTGLLLNFFLFCIFRVNNK